MFEGFECLKGLRVRSVFCVPCCGMKFEGFESLKSLKSLSE